MESLQLVKVLLPALRAVFAGTVRSLPGAGLVDRPVRLDSRMPGRRATRVLGDRELTALAERAAANVVAGLGPALDREPGNEQVAAVRAVADTLGAAGNLDVAVALSYDMRPELLEEYVRPFGEAAAASLSAGASALYDRLLARCCLQIMEFASSRPEFERRAHVEEIRRLGDVQRQLAELRKAVRDDDPGGYRFEQRYAAAVARRLDRLELFGVTFAEADFHYPLSTAFITLSMSGPDGLPEGSAGGLSEGLAEGLAAGGTGAPVGGWTIGAALAANRRLLVRGLAGSGKTTLLHWLAIGAANSDFGADMTPWSGAVPLYVPLRASSCQPDLEDLVRGGAPTLRGEVPAGWVRDRLESGRALVLVDGVDEVAPDERAQLRRWLAELVGEFPLVGVVVTTRPSAVRVGWLAQDGFADHWLEPMGYAQRQSFIEHWHAAARAAEIGDERLAAGSAALLAAMGQQPAVAQLAANPLLCALLCALSLDRRGQLPPSPRELYDAALEMLLVRRDRERGVRLTPPLSRDQAVLVLQRFAYWLVRNGHDEVDRATALTQVERALAGVRNPATDDPGAILGYLLERSGVLREPATDQVDYIHRTFRDYLAAREALDTGSIGELVRNAHDDRWHDVVRMTSAQARPAERDTLLDALLVRAEQEPQLRARLRLLAAACLDQAPTADPDLGRRIAASVQVLIPPRSSADAETLAAVGEIVLSLLPGPDQTDEATAAAVIETAARIGGDAGLAALARFRADSREQVRRALASSWRYFPPEQYAREVLNHVRLAQIPLTVTSDAQIAALAHIPYVEDLSCDGNLTDLAPIRGLSHLRALDIQNNAELRGFPDIAHLPITALLVAAPNLATLDGIAGSPINRLTLVDVPPTADYSALAGLPDLRFLQLAGARYKASLRRLPRDLPVTELRVINGTAVQAPAWPFVVSLHWTGWLGPAERAWLRSLPALRRLTLRYGTQQPQRLARMPERDRLAAMGASGPIDLAALAIPPSLRQLTLLIDDRRPADISPLADHPDLTITVRGASAVHGLELFPNGRVILDACG